MRSAEDNSEISHISPYASTDLDNFARVHDVPQPGIGVNLLSCALISIIAAAGTDLLSHSKFPWTHAWISHVFTIMLGGAMFVVAARVALHNRRKLPVLYRKELTEAQKTEQFLARSEPSVTFRDTSELIQKPQKLAYEESLMSALMESIPDCIYFKDAVCRYTRINKPQAEIMGINDPVEAMGKTDFDFFSPELAENFYAVEQEIIRSGQAWSVILRKLRGPMEARGGSLTRKSRSKAPQASWLGWLASHETSAVKC